MNTFQLIKATPITTSILFVICCVGCWLFLSDAIYRPEDRDFWGKHIHLSQSNDTYIVWADGWERLRTTNFNEAHACRSNWISQIIEQERSKSAPGKQIE